MGYTCPRSLYAGSDGRFPGPTWYEPCFNPQATGWLGSEPALQSYQEAQQGERTMKVSKLMALLLVSALPLAVACKSHEAAEMDDRSDTATQTTEKEISGTNKPNDLNPVEAQTMIDDVTIGHKVE